MRTALVMVLFAVAATGADAIYAPLWLYNGSWQVTRKDLAAGAKPDQLVNDCKLIGKYFACQQTVNGQLSALIIFISRDKPGQYYTQTVTPQGRATARGDLEISGDHWTYSSTWDDGGKTTYYKTTNLFTGKNRIHFEQQESSNGREWTVKNSGDEVRVQSGGKAQ